jgi:hypothetical protein
MSTPQDPPYPMPGPPFPLPDPDAPPDPHGDDPKPDPRPSCAESDLKVAGLADAIKLSDQETQILMGLITPTGGMPTPL